MYESISIAQFNLKLCFLALDDMSNQSTGSELSWRLKAIGDVEQKIAELIKHAQTCVNELSKEKQASIVYVYSICIFICIFCICIYYVYSTLRKLYTPPHPIDLRSDAEMFLI